MITNNAGHPEDLLEALALDALTPEEELAVEGHLAGCAECAAAAAGYRDAAGALAYAAPAYAPPERVRAGLMAAIDGAAGEDGLAGRVSVSRSSRRGPRSWGGRYRTLGGRWGRRLIPFAAGAAAAVVAFVIGLNVQMSGQMGSMEAENAQLRQEIGQNQATATARLARASDSVTQMQGSLQLLRNPMAGPGNRSLAMTAVGADSGMRGVLVVSADGTEGMVMASGLMPPEGDWGYRVWLEGDGERVLAGEMAVDAQGWGALALDVAGGALPDFDAVRVYYGPAGSAGDMALEADLP